MNVDISKILEEVGRLHVQIVALNQIIAQLQAENESLKSKPSAEPAQS